MKIGDNETDKLDKILGNASIDDADSYIKEYTSVGEGDDRPFADYIVALLRERGMTQREVFERAGFSDKYGYRVITQDKHTKQRDYIIRICLAAHLTLKETDRALKLYGMSELYAKVARDAVIIIAINNEVYDIEKVNELLREHGMEPLKESSNA